MYSVPLLYDLDVVYKIAYVGAWVQVEIAAGFMILCFPTLPLLWKSSPMLKRVSNCINTWMRSYFRKRNLDSTRGLPSWYKSHILKSTPQEPDCAAWENIMDCAILMQDSGKELKGCDGGINRSVPCPMSIEEVPRARVRGDDSREIWKSVTYSVDLEGGETSDS